jgi:DNA modification methylase
VTISEQRALEKTNIIYHDDFLNVIKNWPDASFDLILTDIPYNISRPNQLKTMGRQGFQHRFETGEATAFFSLEKLSELERLIKPGGSVLIFHSFQQTYSVEVALTTLLIKDKIIWEKKNPFPRNVDRRYVPAAELISWFVKPGAKWTFNKNPAIPYIRNVMEATVATHLSKFHPTAKPIELLETLIRRHSNPGDLVLDPLAGCFTTLWAASEAGRFAHCIEIDGKYYNNGKAMLNKYNVAYKEG